MKPKAAVVTQGTPVRLPAFIVLSHDDIAVRAYAFYQQRGGAPGCDRDDWHRAERELKAEGEDAERRLRLTQGDEAS
jgi:hypothetical protein